MSISAPTGFAALLGMHPLSMKITAPASGTVNSNVAYSGK
jgi:hypothetical protein